MNSRQPQNNYTKNLFTVFKWPCGVDGSLGLIFLWRRCWGTGDSESRVVRLRNFFAAVAWAAWFVINMAGIFFQQGRATFHTSNASTRFEKCFLKDLFHISTISTGLYGRRIWRFATYSYGIILNAKFTIVKPRSRVDRNKSRTRWSYTGHFNQSNAGLWGKTYNAYARRRTSSFRCCLEN